MEEIIQGWNMELDARAQAFARHAQALQEWDRAILARRTGLLAVEEGVIKVGHSAAGMIWPGIAIAAHLLHHRAVKSIIGMCSQHDAQQAEAAGNSS